MRGMNVDTDVNNYTVSDLLIILDLDEVNSDDITEKTDFYINKFKKTKILHNKKNSYNSKRGIIGAKETKGLREAL